MDALPNPAVSLGRSLCETGWSLLGRGAFAEAERNFRGSLAAVGGHPMALMGLGIAAFEQGRGAEGIALLEQAAAINPRDPQLQYTLGSFLCRTGRYGEALPRLQQAVALNPAPAEPYHDLGLALASLGRHQDALAPYRIALARRPDFAQARLNLALSLLALDRTAEALATFDAAVARNPADGQAMLGRAMALQALGRIGEARDGFAAACRVSPGDPAVLRAYVDSRTIASGDPAIAALEVLRRQPGPPPDQAAIGFALFKAYDDCDCYDQAFAAVTEANRIWRPYVAYDEAAALAGFAAIRQKFSPAVIARAGGPVSDLPVFVIGMPRSGTSLVEQILASHPDVHGAGELGDFGVLAGGYQPDAATLARFVDDPAAAKVVGEGYLQRIARLAPKARRIIDKMPANFLYAGAIAMALPRARIIHVRRNALDTCFSCYAHLFENDLNYSYDLGELGRYYRAYEGLMADWRSRLPAGMMIEVDYEALVADFDREARRLVAHCGLEWNDACTAFHRQQRPVHTASAFQVRTPLYATSIGRAGRYAGHLGELAAALAAI
jgi:Flp pilus assembly protein TadD